MITNPSVEQKEKSNTTHVVIRWLIRETMGVLGQAAVLFLSAGCWDWAMGWAFVILTALWVGATALVVIPRNPELLATSWLDWMCAMDGRRGFRRCSRSPH
jgi:hypothetical protein